MALAAPVEVGTTLSAAQVLVRAVLQVLVLRVGVDGGHQTLLDGEGVVQDLGHRRQAVGGAGGVGDDRVLGRVVVAVVDAHDDGEVLVLRRGGDDDLLRAVVGVHLGLGGVGEQTRRLQDHVHTEVAPGQVARVALLEDLDRLAVHDDLIAGGLHLVGQAAQNAVVLQQVSERRVVGQVIDRDDLDVLATGGDSAPEVATDTAEAVDAYADAHGNRTPRTDGGLNLNHEPYRTQIGLDHCHPRTLNDGSAH
jgi:hypothetical protein